MPIYLKKTKTSLRENPECFSAKSHYLKLFFRIILLLIIISLSFVIGFYLREIKTPVPIQGVTNIEIGQPEQVDFSLFWDAWRIIQEQHIGRENLDYEKMLHGAIQGMVESLEDPHTRFLTPQDSEIFLQDMEGFFEGVGMEIGIREEKLQVIAPLENTPAQKAGLRAGDKIIKIDNQSTSGITIEQAVMLIRGEKGTEVVLTISREEWLTPQNITVTRARIEIPSLSWEIKENNIAHIKLHHFSATADLDFQKIALEILNSPAEKIILDLRNNPGGYLNVAKKITGWFLQRGQIIAIECFSEEGKQTEHRARGNEKLLTYPIVILINQGSASGSEILASALRDNRGIKIIGQTSFGKGAIQQLRKMKQGAHLKVTVANWLTPKGKLIAEKGLTPDIEIEMTFEDMQADKDPQLDKAIEIIKKLR